jgi:hypothetical protein
MNSAPRQSSTTPCADATAKPKAMLLATQPPVTRVTTTVQLTHLGMSGPVRAAPNRNRPSLRDLFPPGSEFAGEPLLGSAL